MFIEQHQKDELIQYEVVSRIWDLKAEWTE